MDLQVLHADQCDKYIWHLTAQIQWHMTLNARCKPKLHDMFSKIVFITKSLDTWKTYCPVLWTCLWMSVDDLSMLSLCLEARIREHESIKGRSYFPRHIQTVLAFAVERAAHVVWTTSLHLASRHASGPGTSHSARHTLALGFWYPSTSPMASLQEQFSLMVSSVSNLQGSSVSQQCNYTFLITLDCHYTVSCLVLLILSIVELRTVAWSTSEVQLLLPLYYHKCCIPVARTSIYQTCKCIFCFEIRT